MTAPEQNDDDLVFKYGRGELPFNSLAKGRLKEYYDRFYENTEFEYYDKNVTRRFLRALLKKARVPSHAVVLDVGCATGFYAEQFRCIGYNAIGLDISRVGILKGQIKYPQLPLLVGDATALPFHRSSFDVLFISGCSLMNTFDMLSIQKYLLYLTRYLNDNGVIILIGGSNFTGESAPNSEWIHHSYHDILSFVDRNRTFVNGPYITLPRLVPMFGKISLSRIFSFAMRVIPMEKMRSIIYFIRRKRD